MTKKARYVCPTPGHTTVTEYEGDPVLPFLIDCQFNCGNVATLTELGDSAEEATHEWYIPVKTRGITKEERRRYKYFGIYLKKKT